MIKPIKLLASALILLMSFWQEGTAGNFTVYQWPVANMEIAIPSPVVSELNLYHFSGNTAWLQPTDSLNWMVVNTNSLNSWGSLRRHWDAYGVHQNYVEFAGQKHVSPTRTFFGAVRYNMDYISGVNQSIEINPYAPDPFVPCDSTQGDFTYIGPTVNIAFSHHILKNLWWGIGLDYQIYRGLKKIYSMPEIIRRYIKLDFSLAWRVTPALTLGVSLRPYNILDIIKVVKQPDGTTPIVLRYRGEFLFTSATSTDDRNTTSEGMEVAPQIMLKFKRLTGIIGFSYLYLWQDVYDGTLVRKYDGYYQGEKYKLQTIWRFFPDRELKNSVTLRYNFYYLTDWAEEPVKRFAIYRSYQRYHDLTIGISRKSGSLHPLTIGAESAFSYYLPDKRDYLARVYREAPMSSYSVKLGGMYSPYPRWLIQAGGWFIKYNEDKVWNYFGDYSGFGASLGVALDYGKANISLTTIFGAKQNLHQNRFRNTANVLIRVRKFL